MPRIEGQEVIVDIEILPDEKGIKKAEYVLTDKASGKVALVQFYGSAVPDFNDPKVQEAELIKYFPKEDSCDEAIRNSVNEALGLVASGVEPKVAAQMIAPQEEITNPSMIARAMNWWKGT